MQAYAYTSYGMNPAFPPFKPAYNVLQYCNTVSLTYNSRYSEPLSPPGTSPEALAPSTLVHTHVDPRAELWQPSHNHNHVATTMYPHPHGPATRPTPRLYFPCRPRPQLLVSSQASFARSSYSHAPIISAASSHFSRISHRRRAVGHMSHTTVPHIGAGSTAQYRH